MTEQPPPLPDQPSPDGRENLLPSAPARSALLVSNLTKLVGIALAINEAVLRQEARNSVIMLCVVLVLGVQAVENVLLRAIDRFFGGSPQ